MSAQHKTWISSDLHFCHQNILKYCPESRGHFTSVEEMNESIVSTFNSVIDEEDTLIIAGDICFARPEIGVEFLKRINGKKKIVWGNHDTKLRESSSFHQSRALIGAVWEGDYLEFDHKFQDRKYKIVVSHYPFLTWNRAHHGAINLHGHGHAPFERRNTQGENVRQMDIGVDGCFMMPHNMDDICSEMSRREIHKHGHHDGSRE
jgi:calcineurin-like phosphoesterase family protein